MKRTHITGFTFFAVMLWLTCVRIPSITLAPGERTNLFAGLLFGVALLAVVAWKYLKQEIHGWSSDATISLVLAGLCITSGLLSDFNPSDTYRATVLVISILSGYWIARLCFSQKLDLRLLMFLFLPALAGFILAVLYAFLNTTELEKCFIGNPHALVDIAILLGFVPLLMLIQGSQKVKIFGALFLVAIVVVTVLSKVRSMLFIPLVIAGILSLPEIKKHLVILALLFFMGASAFAVSQKATPSSVIHYESAYYRAESYKFAAHIILKKPLFGVGLRSPRKTYLTDYDTWYPNIDTETFQRSLQRVRTSENIFLSLAVGCGLPFAFFYIFLLYHSLKQLTKKSRPTESLQKGLRVAFLFPLGCCLLHSLLYDSFLQPEVSFLFHFLLGMTPVILMPKAQNR